MDVTALDKALQNELSWPAAILCPNADGSGEYNLLRQTPQPFRKSKCAGKGLHLSPHSRQRTNGIRIHTTFAAVLGDWDNVKSQICNWAWKGGSVLVSRHSKGTKRSNLLDTTLRCVRCDPFKFSNFYDFQIFTTFATFKFLPLFYHSVRKYLLPFPLPLHTQFDSTGLRSGISLKTIREKHGGLHRISGRHPYK